MNALSTNCECGHEKRDHVFPLIGKHGHGKCKVCLCDRYSKVQAHDDVAAPAKASQA
ncbi:MAG: hypothetical protein ABSG52_05440 [Terriglobales bacterium]